MSFDSIVYFLSWILLAGHVQEYISLQSAVQTISSPPIHYPAIFHLRSVMVCASLKDNTNPAQASSHSQTQCAQAFSGHLTAASNNAYNVLLLHCLPPPAWERRESEQQKREKLVLGGQNSLISEQSRNKSQVSQRQSLITSHKHAEGQTVHPPPPTDICTFFFIAKQDIIKHGQLGTFQSMVATQPFAHTNLACWKEESQKQRKPWHCTNIVLQLPKYWCVISSTLVSNLKQHHRGLILRKLTPSQPDPVYALPLSDPETKRCLGLQTDI